MICLAVSTDNANVCKLSERLIANIKLFHLPDFLSVNPTDNAFDTHS